MTVVKFPYEACRRVHARKPRRSKNGTPAERATLAGAGANLAQMPEPKAATSKTTAPGRMTYTTRELMQALETLDGPDRRYVEGYIQGLVDARKC